MLFRLSQEDFRKLMATPRRPNNPEESQNKFKAPAPYVFESVLVYIVLTVLIIEKARMLFLQNLDQCESQSKFSKLKQCKNDFH